MSTANNVSPVVDNCIIRQNPTAAHQNRPRQQKKRAPRRKGSLSFSYLVGMNVAERLAGLSPWKRDSVANIITRVLAKAELQSLKKGNTIAIPKDILPLIVLVHRFLTEIFCNGHGDDPPQYYPFLAQAPGYASGPILQTMCTRCLCDAFGRRVTMSLSTFKSMTRNRAIHLIEDAMRPDREYAGTHMVVPGTATLPSYLRPPNTAASSASSSDPSPPAATAGPADPHAVRSAPTSSAAGPGPMPSATWFGHIPFTAWSGPMSPSTWSHPTESAVRPEPTGTSSISAPVQSDAEFAPTASSVSTPSASTPSASTPSASTSSASQSSPTACAAAASAPSAPLSAEISSAVLSVSDDSADDSDDSICFVNEYMLPVGSGRVAAKNRVSVIAHTSQQLRDTAAGPAADGGRADADSTQPDVEDCDSSVDYPSMVFDPSTLGGLAGFRPATLDPETLHGLSVGQRYDSQTEFYLPDNRRHHPYMM